MREITTARIGVIDLLGCVALILSACTTPSSSKHPSGNSALVEEASAKGPAGEVAIAEEVSVAETPAACATGERAFTVTNNASEKIWLGVAAGTLACKSDTDCPTQATGSCVGGTCTCQTSGACGAIAQCNSANKFCYWNPPTSAGAAIAAGASQQLCFPAATASSGLQWSGNLFARKGCDSNGQGCQTGDCANAANKPCPTGTGGNPPATLAEFTLSNQARAANGPDFYDISVINGINSAVAMAPVSGTYAAVSGEPYSCGAPGSAASSGGLEACSWKIEPNVGGNDYASHLRDVAPTQSTTCSASVAPNSLGYCECAQDSDCPSKQLCGLAMNASTSDMFTQVCGTWVGWWTADQICGATIASSPYGAPFHCASTVTNSDKTTSTYANLLACTKPRGATNPEQSQSCYSAGATKDCCGCATSASADGKWPIALSPGFGGSDNGCYDNNPNWVEKTQPWLLYLKTACPTAYTYPFDDATSTFTCSGTTSAKGTTTAPSYTITFSDTK